MLDLISILRYCSKKTKCLYFLHFQQLYVHVAYGQQDEKSEYNSDMFYENELPLPIDDRVQGDPSWSYMYQFSCILGSVGYHVMTGSCNRPHPV